MYILSGKGSVAGADLAASVLEQCQQRGVLWGSDLPEYTLDFATQVPSVSKSIREGRVHEIVDVLNAKLRHAEQLHREYMMLCLTAHRLIPQLQTTMRCVNLWDCANPLLDALPRPIAFLGTLESLPEGDRRFVTLPDQVESMGDLITSVKRGYARLGEDYAAHPQHLLTEIVARFRSLGAKSFFLGCTDLHAGKSGLVQLGVDTKNIVDIIEVAATAVIDRGGRTYGTEFLDAVSDARTYLRYKYVRKSDAPQISKKTRYLHALIAELPQRRGSGLHILDIGGSSTGHSLHLAQQLTDQPCHVTLLDISAASLDAARAVHAAAKNITTTFVNEDLENFESLVSFDAILCIGVLLCLSADDEFNAAVRKIADLMKPGAALLTRDCLTSKAGKIYMAFGGVIRNRDAYFQAFIDAGLELRASNEFVIEEPIRRDIVTISWYKP